jgi:hypothetical protein
VKHNIDATIRRLQAQQKQVVYATAVALTRTAQDAARDVEKELPQVLDRPKPFTVKSIAWKSASKATLTSEVYIRPAAAAYLAPLITGGKVLPKKRALLEPGTIKLDQYGNIPRNAITRLRARKDVFSGQVRGIAGLWQRTKRGLKLLVRYEPAFQKRKQFPFADMVRRSVQRNWQRNFERELSKAMATAR